MSLTPAEKASTVLRDINTTCCETAISWRALTGTRRVAPLATIYVNVSDRSEPAVESHWSVIVIVCVYRSFKGN